MTENLEELIQKIVEYILANSEKSPLLGVERDYALLLAQEIGARISREVLVKFHERNGEKKQ